MMDGSAYACLWEIATSIAGISILFFTGDWFGRSVIHPFIKYFILAYFIVAAGVSLWFTFNKRQDEARDLAMN